jgi:hypothetical protein
MTSLLNRRHHRHSVISQWKGVSKMAREIKERPGCRKAILNLGIRPFIFNGEWDGRTAVLRDSGEQSTMSDDLRKQMRLMAAEGYWGEVKVAKWRRRRKPTFYYL